MDERPDELNEEVVAFHRVIEKGSLDELNQLLKRGVDVNAPGHVEKTALMVAVDAKSIEKMKRLVEQGADLELTDRFNSTALRHAVSWDFADGVRYLLSLDVDRGYHPKYPLKKVDYGSDMLDIDMPAEMQGLLSEEEWKASMAEMQESILELGRNPTVEPIIADVQSVEVLKLFLRAGDDLNLAPTEVKREYIGLGEEKEFQCSLADFRRYKSPMYGTSNPQRMDNPFWRDMVMLGCNAYVAREHFDEPDPFRESGVVWCYDRLGSSLTELPDGRFVQIAGEHEDYYDPDFYIYNDVVIHDGQGGIQIYGYPMEVLPPTDFHSATLVGDQIYIIGCIGYPEQRKAGETPVYRMELNSWKIEQVATSGETPSWLHRHRSIYDGARNAIRCDRGKIFVTDDNGEFDIVSNEESFELDLVSFEWRRVK